MWCGHAARRDDDVAQDPTPGMTDETPDPPSTVGRSDLRSATLSSARWVALGRGSSQTVAFVALVAVSHLVPPSAVAHAAIALLVTQLASTLSTFGFGARVVREKELDRRETGLSLLLSWAVGITAGLITVVVSVVALRPIFGPEVEHLVQLAAVAFPISALAAVPMGLLERQLAFRAISTIESAGYILGPLSSVGLAAAGLNASALVIGQLVTLGVISAAVLVMAPAVKPAWANPRRILQYGIPATFSGILYILYSNIDYALLGARLPATQVGYYVRAYQLGSDYQSKISGIMLRVALPVFSRAKDTADLREIRMRITRVHATVLLPLLFLLMGTAPQTVPFRLGSAWRGAVLPTQILTVGGMVGAVGTGTGPLLLAMGRATTALVYNAAVVVVYAIGIWLAAPYGIVTVSVVAVAIRMLGLATLLRGIIQPLVGIPASDTVTRDIAPAAVSAVPLLAIAFGGTWAIGHWHLAPAPSLAVIFVLALTAYAATLRALFKSSWADAMQLVPSKLRQRPRAAARVGSPA